MRLRSGRIAGISSGVGPPIPSLDLNFAGQTTGSVDGRASSWWNRFKGGTTQPDEFFDAGTGAVSYGPHNLIRNSEAVGAVVSGAFPTNWFPAQVPPGTTLTVVGVGSGYVDFRFVGTPTNSQKCLLGVEAWNPEWAGRLLYGSITVQVLAGGTGISGGLSFQAAGLAGPAFLTAQLTSPTQLTFNHVPVSTSPPWLLIDCQNGVACDVTLRLSRVQLNYGGPNTYVPTTSSAIYSTIPRITFSRGSLATRIGPTGLVEWAPHNLIAQGNTLADWASGGPSGTSLITVAEIAPDGTGSVTKIRTLSNSVGQRTRNQPVAGANVAFTFSVHLKAAEFSTVRIGYTDQTTGGVDADFDLATGAQIGSTLIGGSWTNASFSFTPLPNGWYRVRITATKGAGTNCVPFIQLRTNAGSLEVPGDGVSGVLAWGAQLNIGSLQPYWPTTGLFYHGPRFTHDPVTFAPLGLLIEEQRTNLLQQSENFADAYWAPSQSTTSSNQGTAPDGRNTASAIRENTASNFHSANASVAVVSGSVYAFSAYVKAAGRTRGGIYYNDSTFANGPSVSFDLTAETISNAIAVGTGVIVGSGIQRLSNGWYRVWVVGSQATSGSGRFGIGTQNASGQANYTGDGTSGLLVWGAQVELGAFPTSYIPTTSASVTRLADSATMTGTNFSSWFRADQGTVIQDGLMPRYVSDIPALHGFTGANAGLFIDASSKVGHWNGSMVIGLSDAIAAGIRLTAALSFTVNSRLITANGLLPVGSPTEPFDSLPTQVRIGSSSGGSQYLNTPIARIRYYPRALNAATLQRLTR